MAASGKTARRLLQFWKTTDAPTISAWSEALANQLDNDAETGNVAKFSELPGAKTRGRIWQVTADTVNNGIYWDTGAAWIRVAPPGSDFVLRESAISTEAKPGELILATANITVTAPPPTIGNQFAVCSGNNAAVVVKRNGAELIFGDFIEAASSVTLNKFQHIVLFPNGGEWFIIAGEPMRQQTYSGTISKTKAEMEAGVEVSPYRPGYIIFKNGAAETNGLTIGGVAVILSSNGVQYYVPPGQKVKNTNPATSEYQTILL